MKIKEVMTSLFHKVQVYCINFHSNPVCTINSLVGFGSYSNNLWFALNLCEPSGILHICSKRSGKWYLENCRSQKLFIQSPKLGTASEMCLEILLL